MSMLEAMVKGLCGKEKDKLFWNRESMMQALINIPGDHLVTRGYDDYSGADELIEGIKMFLGRSHAERACEADKELHKAMIMNLVKPSPEGIDLMNVKSDRGNKGYLTLEIDQTLKSNINHMIKDRRPIPLYWRKAYKKDINTMCYRLAWVLQYLEVYFYGDCRMAEKVIRPVSANGYTSFYELRQSVCNSLELTIKETYATEGMEKCDVKISGFYDLAIALVDMIEAAYEGHRTETPEYTDAMDSSYSFKDVMKCREMCDNAGKLLDRYARGEKVDLNEICRMYQTALSGISA